MPPIHGPRSCGLSVLSQIIIITNTVIREITKCLKKMKIIYLKLLTRSYIVYSSMQKDSKSTGSGILR